ncbi:uncharacterized protein M6B38_356530 [Iris pallida]|uniref:Uncharacterized protein n=1 Tax=Iris pallida TaxID=29817 RepID=A0AAX6GMB7_IRIPA|nr:uncharacterized protein M6B38_356530 [Iris pallida]
MGCVGSKLEELEAVALCRDRTELLAEAIRHRYAFADAHAAYADSLRSVCVSLHRLLEASSSVQPPPSPHLPLPPQRKGGGIEPLPTLPPQPPSSAAAGGPHRHSHSGSGSHIQFHSSDSEGDDDLPLHSSDDDNYEQQQQEEGEDGAYHHLHRDEPVVHHLHYARNQPPPNSVSYEHRPQSPESGTIHYASTSSPYPPYPPSYPNSSYPPSYPYPDPDPYGGGGYPPNTGYGYYGSGSGGGFFGSSSSSLPPQQPPWGAPGASTSSSSAAPKPPPPPPSPPRASTWDFLNPFHANESYYPPYTPSRSSNEVREAEGIPDLEDEEHEVVKEAYGDRKSVPSASTSASGSPIEHIMEGKGKGKSSAATENSSANSHYQTRSVVGAVDEADVVEKKVVGERPQEEIRNVATAAAAAAPPANPRRFLDVSDIGGEIKIQGDRAFSLAMELSGVLELGKHPYHLHRSAVYKVPTVMMCVMPPSSMGDDFLNFEEDMERSSKTLSSTLQKLYIWEKKLQDEVRAEERMRLLHDRNCKKLKRLDERGAEAHKLDEVQKIIRKLSTKIKIAIQVVNTISTKINKLRDEELWPRIKELIQGLVRMWKGMLECHRIQCEAISEAKSLDSIASGGRLGETCLEAMMQLELELLRWIGNFSAWINAQKNYVKAMNGWLILCLHYEPEVTADGIPPYSPGRVGAPPVFVICNYWSQALDRLSEKEVIDAMQAFATNLRRLWEQNSAGHQQMRPNRDMDRWVKAREREAQIMHKEVDALNKKLVLVSGENGLPNQTAEASSLHLGLRQVFEAMENFIANSLRAYEELHTQSEEEEAAGDSAGGP